MSRSEISLPLSHCVLLSFSVVGRLASPPEETLSLRSISLMNDKNAVLS